MAINALRCEQWQGTGVCSGVRVRFSRSCGERTLSVPAHALASGVSFHALPSCPGSTAGIPAVGKSGGSREAAA